MTEETRNSLLFWIVLVVGSIAVHFFLRWSRLAGPSHGDTASGAESVVPTRFVVHTLGSNEVQ